MPAIIGEAISTISSGTSVKKEHMDIAREIFSMVGEVIEIDEKSVDAVTAISGSGPAYFYYLIEALIDAAGKLKIERKTAERLVIKTAVGSIKLLDALKEGPDALRRRITSKGGTTDAAVKIFDRKKFKNIVQDATAAACRRSKELSKG